MERMLEIGSAGRLINATLELNVNIYHRNQDPSKFGMREESTGGTVHIQGLPMLSDNELQNPVTVRWATVSPGGIIEIHHSENWIGFDTESDIFLQWQLVLDICGVLDPASECTDHRMEVHQITDDENGMILEPCLRHASGRDYPHNPCATNLVAELSGRQRDPRPVYGTAVWLGYADPDGIHASITDDAIARLRTIVAQPIPAPAQNR